MTTDSFYSVDELAARWRCGRKSVIEAIKEGRLAAFRLGKRTYRIAAAEVTRFEMAVSSTAGPLPPSEPDIDFGTPEEVRAINEKNIADAAREKAARTRLDEVQS